MLKPDSIPRLLILVLLVVGTAWVGVALVCLVIGTTSSPTLQFLGQAGDTFGVVNSLFSGIAMCGAVYTVYLQTRQMEAQENHLLEQKKHEEEMLRRQKFEKFLFQVVEFHACILELLVKLSDEGTTQIRTAASAHTIGEKFSTLRALPALYFPSIANALDTISPRPLLQDLQEYTKVSSTNCVDAVIDSVKDLSQRIRMFRDQMVTEIEVHIRIPSNRPS